VSDLEKFMLRCIELAQLAAGRVSPNPMVGCVIVNDGQIIAEGYHEQYGAAHAEVNAIRAVLDNFENAETILKKSEIYVSLEPCAHYGKTPPCVDFIIRHAIPKVIIGCRDPFDQVNGKGIEILRHAGIEVITGVLEAECENLNKRFFTRVRMQRPYIILKWAQTADGYFAPENNSQEWISSESSKVLVHKWRNEEDAVLVGKNTALIDNPQLNARLIEGGRNPKRIVIDRRLELPKSLHLFDHASETIVFNEIKTEISGNVKYIQLEDFDQYLPQLIAYQLYIFDIQSVIIEGGAKTLDMFSKAGLWDEARVFVAPKNWGKGIKAPAIATKPAEVIAIGPDSLQIHYATTVL
jgi:diaminohydroxyphosphoribosylaminopyrimidine deaminase / 5-amino-6-(5-phosphoribosylamino)uracil reductase